MTKNSFSLIVLLLFYFPAIAGDDWALFQSSDPSCKSPPSGFEIKGDFDGNGKTDVARLQANRQQKKRRLAIWMNGEAKPIVLDEKAERYAGNYLNLKSPGTVEPYVDSADKTPVKIEFEALSSGSCEASEVIYYWDKKTKKFKEVWTGD